MAKPAKDPRDFPETVAWSRDVGAGNFGPTHSADRRLTMTLCGLRIPSADKVWRESVGDGSCARCEAAERRFNREGSIW